MKRKIARKGFDLNKQTVANLTDFEQQRVVAGGVACPTQCVFSNSAVFFISSIFVNAQTIELPADKRYWPCYMEPPTG